MPVTFSFLVVKCSEFWIFNAIGIGCLFERSVCQENTDDAAAARVAGVPVRARMRAHRGAGRAARRRRQQAAPPARRAASRHARALRDAQGRRGHARGQGERGHARGQGERGHAWGQGEKGHAWGQGEHVE